MRHNYKVTTYRELTEQVVLNVCLALRPTFLLPGNQRQRIRDIWASMLASTRRETREAIRAWLTSNNRPASDLQNVYCREDLQDQRIAITATFNNRDAALLYRLSRD